MKPYDFKQRGRRGNRRGNRRGKHHKRQKSPDEVGVNWETVDPPILPDFRNQGEGCSCWAIVATAAIESAYNILNPGSRIALSPQGLIDFMVPDPEDDIHEETGTFTASTERGFAWVRDNGIAEESTYPFTGRRSPKPMEGYIPLFKIDAYKFRTTYNTAIKMIKIQPISAVIRLTDEFMDIKKEIYCGPRNRRLLLENDEHAVLVVGYGKEADHEYFVIMNSYGVDFGDRGFARVSRRPVFYNNIEYLLLSHFTFPVLKNSKITRTRLLKQM